MASDSTSAGGLNAAVGHFRWLFMPLGLLALIALGVHAAADIADDFLLRAVESVDVWLDGWFAQGSFSAKWVDAVGSSERTVIARGLALAWELFVDITVALPAMGYSEKLRTADPVKRFTLVAKVEETWSLVFKRLARAPTPMRLIRPLVTLTFCIAGAYAVSRLVEGTLFVSLSGLLTGEQPLIVARIVGGLAMLLVTISLGWRATLRSLQHADRACTEALTDNQSPWLVGLWGSAFALPLAIAWLQDAQTLLSFFR